MLKIDNISCSEGGKSVIKNLSFSLESYEIGAIMGKNGVGKSTLLRAIAGFIPIDKGSISFDGTRLSADNWTLDAAKRSIGMVFQDLALFPHLRVRDNITFGLKKSTARSNSKSNETRMKEICKLLHAESLLDKYPFELSGGEQQRVAIARTLITHQPLMLLDEPFANLDISLKHEFSFSIRRYLQDNKLTALVISHDRAEALNICDRIGEMKDGRMLFWYDKRDNSDEAFQSLMI